MRQKLWFGLGLIAKVSGTSMLPTLYPGDIVWALRPYRRYREGDIVIACIEDRWLIKRVAQCDFENQCCYLGVEFPFGWLPMTAIKAHVIGVWRISRARQPVSS